jgi:hypothetical protein
MPNPLTSVILRLALIQGSRDKIIDKLSNKLPAIPRGNGVSLQCALFTADPREASLVDTFTGISSVTMQVRKDNALGDALFDKTVAIGDFDDTGLTWAEWDANTNQHLTIALTAAETGQAMPSGKDSLAIYIAFEATPVTGDPIFLGSITTTIFEDGIGSSGSPVVGDPTYLTASESDARYLASHLIGAAIPNGQNYVDIDLTAFDLATAPTDATASIIKPNSAADNIAIAGISITDETAIRVHLQAPVPSVGYRATLIFKP